jgi:hypothetical protein
MRLTVLLCVLATLTGCQTTPIVIDAGCTTWGAYQIRPSRADTVETARGLFVLNEAMTAACR